MKKGWKISVSEGPRNRVPKGPFLQDLGEVGFGTIRRDGVGQIWRPQTSVCCLRSGLWVSRKCLPSQMRDASMPLGSLLGLFRNVERYEKAKTQARGPSLCDRIDLKRLDKPYQVRAGTCELRKPVRHQVSEISGSQGSRGPWVPRSQGL